MPRRLEAFIPQSAEELTADWLTDAVLPPDGPPARVVDFEVRRPGTGVGYSGVSVRVGLTWEPADPELPQVVLVKFPTPVATNRGLVESEGGYDREFDFYERFGGSFPVPVPALHYDFRDPGRPWSSYARQFRLLNRSPDWVARLIGRHSRKMVRPTRRRFVLVLGYVENARLTPLDGTPSEADLQTALATQASVHANWWRSPVLREDVPFGWRTATQVPHILNGTYAVHRDAVLGRQSGLVGPTAVDLADWVDDNLTEVVDHLDEPLALLHGDARGDNLLFTDDGLTLIDFGMVSSGRPAWDVGYLLSSMLPAGEGSRAEVDRLCADYHHHLVAAGVGDHSWAQFRNDVDLVLVYLLHRMLLADAVFEGEGYGEGDMSTLWLRKLVAQLPEEPPVIGQVT